MNKRILIFLGSVLLAVPTLCFAKEHGNSGNGSPHPNQSAYEHANENARFKRDENWKADKEAKKEESKIKRQTKKTKMKVERKVKKVEKKAKEAKEQIEN